MKREEWQANFAASCGLMPRNSVIETWRERFGATNARILKRKNRVNLPSDASGEMAEVCRSINEQRDDEAMNEFARPFAEKYLVSMVAMRIRLERLGLLHREVPRQRSLAVGV
jgi:Zn-dependent peptidase ImmA (M78 family)